MRPEPLWSDIVFLRDILEMLFNVDASKLSNDENCNQSDNENHEFRSD